MGFLRRGLLAALVAAAFSPGAALAADMPIYEAPPAPAPVYGGWYLRGDIGYTAQNVGSLYNLLYDTTAFVYNYEKDFEPSYSVGLGVGYRFSDYFRVDVTGEYRGPSDFHGYETYDTDGDLTIDGDDLYTGYKTEWTFLANVYVDLFHWGQFTPFVGAGVGASYNKINDFLDTNVMNASVAHAADTGTWNFAWALYAGVGWQVTPRVTVELAYRYLDLGSAKSGDLISADGINYVPNNPMVFNDLTSQDIKLGVRYAF
jgi:opacity protein-like surface antigen